MPVATRQREKTADRKGIKDRDTIVDMVCAYMHDHHKALSIDTLLTRPLDAMRMGLYVATRQQRIDDSDARAIAKILGLLEKYTSELDAIDEVCRAALNARKHGDVKPDKY